MPCVTPILRVARLASVSLALVLSSSPGLASPVVLQVPLTLETVEGAAVTLDPGIYNVEQSGPSQIDITSDRTLTRYLVSARPGTHEETLEAPFAVLVPVRSGPLHLVLMLPDGQTLEAVAGPSGVTTRGKLTTLTRPDLSRYAAAQRTRPTVSKPCPRCPTCPRCRSCPPPTRCPRCPTCPSPNTCPEQPTCPTCPAPTVCPDPPPCPDATCPGDEVAEPPPPSGPQLIDPAVQQQLVDMHNAVRAGVQSPNGPLPPLVWDDAVAAVAQAWVDTCPGAVHNPDRRLPPAPGFSTGALLGENLALNSGLDIIQTGMSAWSAEAQFYDYGSNTCQSGQICGHFTQLVWRDSLSVGCGIRTSCGGQGVGGLPNIMVCNYFPPGNFNGQRPH